MSGQLELYQQVILEHNRKPKNFGKPEHFTHEAEGFNPLCGDHLYIYLSLNSKTGELEKLSFTGTGCAICKASASMMTTSLCGLKKERALEVFESFHALLQNKKDLTEESSESLGKLTVFSNIWKYPLRIKCASLAWHTFVGALKNSKKPISTEEKEHAQI